MDTETLSESDVRSISYRTLIARISCSITRRRVMQSRWSLVAVAVGISLIPPSVAVAYLALRIMPSGPSTEQVAVVTSVTAFLLLCPLLMTVGQTWLESLLSTAREDGSRLNLDLSQFVGKQRRVDRWCYPISVGFAVFMVALFLLMHEELGEYLGLDFGVWDLVLGSFASFFLGLGAGDGIWAVLKVTSIQRGLTQIGWPWFPFKPYPIPTLEKLCKYSYLAALISSCGVLFLPVSFSLASSGHLVTRVAAVFCSGVLFFASSMLLTYPYLQLRRLESRQRTQALSPVGVLIESWLPEFFAGRASAERTVELRSALEAWRAIRSESVAAVASTTTFVPRLMSTFILPIVAAVVAGMVLQA